MLFFRQLGVLFWKNWVVLLKHPFLNVLRCFIFPIAYGIFLAVAQIFLSKPNNFGLGTAIPVLSLDSQFDGSLALIWADGTNGTGVPAPDDIMAQVTSGFSSSQLRAVKKVATPDDIAAQCPQNFNLFSECFAAVSFDVMPTTSNSSEPINYTILADGGLFHIDVVHHASDFERRILPLQWAVDKAIIDLKTGEQMPTPMELPFSQETNTEQNTDIRLSYIRGLRSLLVLALFLCYIGIVYQLPGSFMGERANLLTSHLQAMGLLNSARIISWHLSISLAYLPAWIIVAIIWHFRIFTGTNVGLVLVIHLLMGLSLASWSFFIAAPFGKSPQLAAVCSTFLAVLFAILAQAYGRASSGAAFIFSIVFPPGFYIFAIRAVAGFEVHQIPTNVFQPDPDNHLRLLPLIVAAIIDVFLWPCLAVLLESRLYDAKEPSSGLWSCFGQRAKARETEETLSSDTAISIRNLGKTFNTSIFRRKKSDVTAISDLTLRIPKFGIFVLLGSNGAGKSTTLSIVGGLLGRSRGTVTFEGGVAHPPRGTLGIVPQKNVLFSELTCHQTLRVWSAIKRPVGASADSEDIDQLLHDCDLGKKIHSNASTLSGGQKRKLQLAIGLVGGSKILLVDECSSGVDPLSRRALWRTLTSVRQERTVVLTTHFLDEADLLADHIAILASPGTLVAEGSPVSLKSTLGEGYSVQVSLNQGTSTEKLGHSSYSALLRHIRTVAPNAYVTFASPTLATYHLKAKDSSSVERVLQLLDTERMALGVTSYDIHGTSLEDIFLKLMAQHNQSAPASLEIEKLDRDGLISSEVDMPSEVDVPKLIELTQGRSKSAMNQAFTIFHKRVLITRRSWLTPLLTIIVPIAGACIPLFFMAHRTSACTSDLIEMNVTVTPLYLPFSLLGNFLVTMVNGSQLLTAPPNVAATLGSTVSTVGVMNVADNTTFLSMIDQNYLDLSLGGISINLQSGASLFAWEASPPGLSGLTLLNFVDNILYNSALNSSGKAFGSVSLITAGYESFPAVASGSLVALKWLAFYGAAMAAFPAFFSLYVSRERHSSVQAMQFSNGLSNPVGLWLGHILFDSMLAFFIATIITIVFATASHQFQGLGLLWVVLALYGIVGALFAYAAALFTASPLAAFAAVAGYQVIMFILYVAGYLLTYTYAKTSSAGQIITNIHFTMSLLSPVASVLRAAFVSINQFSLLCDEGGVVTLASMRSILKFGGPILYLFVYGFALFALLVWYDSGSILPRRLPLSRRKQPSATLEGSSVPGRVSRQDVTAEAEVVATSQDSLRILHVTKTFSGSVNKAVDNVSFGVSQNTMFALLGPNGAGKTSLFNIVRGDIIPDEGDVLIQGTSVIHHPRAARLALGVCPQFTAIDSQLTVREHLMIYGRLKGLRIGTEVAHDVDALMNATALMPYADRLASKLSGGNQRKLSLAIALIGNPSVILIDEFSTGIDAKMKREMWSTLRNVAIGKAVVITTHSMEEASALASKVGILAGKMLALGTTESLAARYATYEVHMSCRTPEDVARAQRLMTRIPGARMADDVATRFEVPIEGTENDGGVSGRLSLAQLFTTLSAEGDFSEYAVERVSLETVFLKVIRENNVLEEDRGGRKKPRWRMC